MATSFHLVNNNAASTLASAIDDNDLAASVATGEGAEFDTGKQYLTIGRSDTYAGEIVDVTSRSSDAFTIASRAADGTTATAHEAGEAVECLLVAAHITELQTAINGIENGTTTLAQVKLGDDTGKLIFGNDSDIQFVYDETTDDRLEITDGTNVLAFLKDNGTSGIWGVNEIQVTSGTTATLYNTTATTINAFGAATAVAIGGSNSIITLGANTGSNQITINGAAGAFRSIGFASAGGRRWLVTCESTAEGGSNAGSNLQIRSYADDGSTLVDVPFQIARVAGGNITIGRPLVGATTQAVFNTTSTTINFGGAASTGINIGNASGPITFAGKIITTLSSTTRAYFNLPHGAAPSSPVDGDIWTTSAGLYVRINGATVGPLS